MYKIQHSFVFKFFLFLNHIIGFYKSLPLYRFRYIKLNRNVLSIYKLEIKTHLLKGTNISHLLSFIEKAFLFPAYTYIYIYVCIYMYIYVCIYIYICMYVYIIYILYVLGEHKSVQCTSL